MDTFTKKKRWNPRTRNFELLELNDSMQTKDEALKWQKEFDEEHSWQQDI